MSGTIWGKFFWSDWLSDVGLRRCTPAARGIWMDMLAIAAQHDPPGYVAVNGQGLEVEDIARLVGLTQALTQPLTDELERNAVFSRTSDGIIYSRRMVRDHQRAERARVTGKAGGNPALRKGSGIRPTDKGQVKAHDKAQDKAADKAPVNGEDKATLGPRYQIPDTISQTKEKQERPPVRERSPGVQLRLDIADAYLAAGNEFPPDTSEAEVWVANGFQPALCLAVTKAVLARKADAPLSYIFKVIQSKATERAPPTPPPKPPPEAISREMWDELVGMVRTGSASWPSGPGFERFGPPPGQPGCRVPPDILVTHGYTPR